MYNNIKQKIQLTVYSGISYTNMARVTSVPVQLDQRAGRVIRSNVRSGGEYKNCNSAYKV